MKHEYGCKDFFHPQKQRSYPTEFNKPYLLPQNGYSIYMGVVYIPIYYPVCEKQLCCEYWDGRGYWHRCALKQCPAWGPNSSTLYQVWEVSKCEDCK
ncbi:hypothetical protein C6X96_12840 [Bacillus pumilus]|nr:hypothetical protein C6X96_12840 [Bacillus pumilus]